MAQYVIPDPEDHLICPYDKVHVVRAKRFQYHLLKCRKNYSGNDCVSCPFNATHVIPRPEFMYHVANCDDKCRIMQDIVQQNSDNDEGTYFKGDTSVPSYHHNNIAFENASEDWDLEPTCLPCYGVNPFVFGVSQASRNSPKSDALRIPTMPGHAASIAAEQSGSEVFTPLHSDLLVAIAREKKSVSKSKHINPPLKPAKASVNQTKPVGIGRGMMVKGKVRHVNSGVGTIVTPVSRNKTKTEECVQRLQALSLGRGVIKTSILDVSKPVGATKNGSDLSSTDGNNNTMVSNSTGNDNTKIRKGDDSTNAEE